MNELTSIIRLFYYCCLHMKARISIILAIILLITSTAITCSKPPSPPTGTQPPVVWVEPPTEGKQAPDFTLMTLDGRSLSLSDFRGKIVVLSFWGVACPACVREMPHFQAVSEKWSTEEVVVLAVHVEGSKEVIQKIVDKFGLTFPIPLDSDGAVCDMYGRGYPTTFFIDRSGIVRVIHDEVFYGPDDINNIITSLVSESET